MKNNLRVLLGRIASSEFQRLFCIGGTKAEYILPQEMLESAANLVQTILGSPMLSRIYSEKQLDSLRRFLHLANTLAPALPINDAASSVKDLIENNPAWHKLQQAAQEALNELDVSISLEELLARS